MYKLPSPHKLPENRLELWYSELLIKELEDLSLNDIIRMIKNEILVELAVSKAFIVL
ncbi:contact-dependent growth inhibition system immunity protein [Jeotgalibacillus sp. ET6]|uniref:contact-dependent growth inhibition system immunity protein n=1 Tax=Jeotgalibacillus sp. ET6 TaxID=3037260 RepID=UPI003FA561D4